MIIFIGHEVSLYQNDKTEGLLSIFYKGAHIRSAASLVSSDLTRDKVGRSLLILLAKPCRQVAGYQDKFQGRHCLHLLKNGMMVA